MFSIFLFFQNFPFYMIDCVNTRRKQAGRSKFLFPKFTEKIKDNITQLILDDWLLCRRICLGLGRVTHREQERWSHWWNHVSLSTTKSYVRALYKYKSNRWWVALGLGYRFSYSVLFMTSETERMRGRKGEKVKERERKELVRTNLHSWALEFLGWSTFESLAGCAPYANAFTIELTIGLQARVPTLRETRVSYRY